jgi:hypothetical protein
VLPILSGISSSFPGSLISVAHHEYDIGRGRLDLLRSARRPPPPLREPQDSLPRPLPVPSASTCSSPTNSDSIVLVDGTGLGKGNLRPVPSPEYAARSPDQGPREPPCGGPLSRGPMPLSAVARDSPSVNETAGARAGGERAPRPLIDLHFQHPHERRLVLLVERDDVELCRSIDERESGPRGAALVSRVDGGLPTPIGTSNGASV